MATADWTKPATLVAELFDDDKWIKDKFSEALSTEILALAEKLAPCFARFNRLDEFAKGDERASFVASYIYGVLDDLIVSTKLLVSGKINPAGNTMRQAVEGLAIALLCSTEKLIWVEKKKKLIQINYLEKLKDNWSGILHEATLLKQ